MLALVVVAHPSTDSYCHALAARAQSGLSAAGHEVIVLDLYASGFRAAMSLDERAAYERAIRFSTHRSRPTPSC